MRRLPFLLALLTLGVVPLASPNAQALQPVKVAENVYAFIGELGEPSPENAGNVGNSGFIVGDDGIVVIDTGISYRHGREMLTAIAQVSGKPVRLVIITHAVQEFLFGNAAYDEIGVPVLAHAKSVELMRQRCEHCLANLQLILGPETMRGSRLVLPSRVVDGSTTLTIAGRRLELLYFGWASTSGDLAVFDRASGVLFAGGLVSSGRVPEVRDSNLQGWLDALDQLERLPCARVVPGHGPVITPAGIGTTRSYLLDLDRKVQQLYRSGASLMEAVDAADLPQYHAWGMYPSLHRKNILQRYLQLELEELGG